MSGQMELAEVIARALWEREREEELSKSQYLDDDAVPVWDDLGEPTQRGRIFEARSVARAVEAHLSPPKRDGIDARHDILDRWADQVMNTAAPDQVARVMGEYRDLRSAIPGPSRADS